MKEKNKKGGNKGDLDGELRYINSKIEETQGFSDPTETHKLAYPKFIQAKNRKEGISHQFKPRLTLKKPKAKQEKFKLKPKKQLNKSIIKSQKTIENTKRIYKSHFDDLVDLVNQKKIVPLSQVVKDFNIDKKIANEWGHLLHEHQLISFHIPPFGEPEFRRLGEIPKKMRVKSKLNLKKILIYSGIISAVLAVFLIIFLIPQQKTTEFIKEKIESKIELPETTKEIDKDLITLAFSGNGSYECRTLDMKTKYTILNKDIRIERLDIDSKIIIKGNSTYTYNFKTDNWKISEVKKGLSIPGSGIPPKIELDCIAAPINKTEFITI